MSPKKINIIWVCLFLIAAGVVFAISYNRQFQSDFAKKKATEGQQRNDSYAVGSLLDIPHHLEFPSRPILSNGIDGWGNKMIFEVDIEFLKASEGGVSVRLRSAGSDQIFQTPDDLTCSIGILSEKSQQSDDFFIECLKNKDMYEYMLNLEEKRTSK
jgi:hypothetical protein